MARLAGRDSWTSLLLELDAAVRPHRDSIVKRYVVSGEGGGVPQPEFSGAECETEQALPKGDAEGRREIKLEDQLHVILIEDLGFAEGTGRQGVLHGFIQ